MSSINSALTMGYKEGGEVVGGITGKEETGAQPPTTTRNRPNMTHDPPALSPWGPEAQIGLEMKTRLTVHAGDGGAICGGEPADGRRGGTTRGVGNPPRLP